MGEEGGGEEGGGFRYLAHGLRQRQSKKTFWYSKSSVIHHGCSTQTSDARLVLAFGTERLVALWLHGSRCRGYDRLC